MTIQFRAGQQPFEIIRNDGPLRIRTGGPGLRGLPGPAGAGDVLGPAGATNDHIALFDGDGKHLKDGGIAVDRDPTFAAASDDRLPSQTAVAGYVARNVILDYELPIYKADGITAGGYYADRRARQSVHKSVYMEIIDGDAGAEVDAYIEVAGVMTYGPFTVAPGAPYAADALAIAVPAGAKVNLVISAIVGGAVRDVYFRSSGALA